MPASSKPSFLTRGILVGLLGLASLAGCSDTIREHQMPEFHSIEHLTDLLFKMNVLTNKDRLLVVRLPYPQSPSDPDAPSKAAQDFFEDSFVAGLLKDGAVVLQDLAITNSPITGALDGAIAHLSTAPGASASAELTALLEASRTLAPSELYVDVGGRTVAIGRTGNVLTDDGITKVVLYRWVYHSAPSDDGDETGYTGNRVFVRIIDAATGYVIWSDLLVSPE